MKPKFSLTALSVLILLLAFGPAIDAQEPKQVLETPAFRSAIEEIDGLVAAEFEKSGLGSVAVGIVVGPDVVWTKSYGFADMEMNIPANRKSVYRIGSITKQFTGLMLLQLVEEGKVHLSDPVENYLPEAGRIQGRFEYAPPVTLVQLATMTSGIAREPANLPAYLKGPVGDWEKVMIKALEEVRYAHEPGTRYLYSNIGYAILGAALGRAAGKPFVDHVRERVLQPLGMTHSAFEPNETIRPHITKGYARRRNGDVNTEAPAREHAGRGYKVPNGALYTTVDDLARFVSFELGYGPESVLPRKTLEENFSRVHSSNGPFNSGYGIGFMAFRRGDLIIHGHGGSVAGYRAGAYFNREASVGFVLLRNASDRFDIGGLSVRALKLLSAARPEPVQEQ